MPTLLARFNRSQRQLEQGDVGAAMKGLYDVMFDAKTEGHPALADHAMNLLEKMRKQHFSKPLDPQMVKTLTSKLPTFARQVLNQNTIILERPESANCINAALNFSEFYPRFEPYSPMEFLDILQKSYRQLDEKDEFQFGDLIAAWSRFEMGVWQDRKITVGEMNQKDPQFPFGLIFDHVVVRLTPEIVFHKPDPTPQSLYQMDFLSAAIAATKQRHGFELTYHRKIQK
jgi:hypothetical protein